MRSAELGTRCPERRRRHRRRFAPSIPGRIVERARSGPASSVRAIVDVAVIPLLKLLGFDVSGRLDETGRTTLTAYSSSGAAVPVFDRAMGRTTRPCVARPRCSTACAPTRAGASAATAPRGGSSMRITRGHVDYLEFDLTLVASEAPARTIFWSVARCRGDGGQSAFSGSRRSALGPSRSGRLQGARRRSARGSWSPVHGTGGVALATFPTRVVRAVSDGALPDPVSSLCGSARPGSHVAPDLSRALQHRSDRLGAAGRTEVSRRVAGDSRDLTAGPLGLFGWSAEGDGVQWPPLRPCLTRAAFDRTHIEDAVMADAVMAVGTTRTPSVGRTRISYADLDVEQLGAVYERVLEYRTCCEEWRRR